MGNGCRRQREPGSERDCARRRTIVLEQILEGLQIDRLAYACGILQRNTGVCPKENVIEIRAQNDGSNRVVVDLSGQNLNHAFENDFRFPFFIRNAPESF